MAITDFLGEMVTQRTYLSIKNQIAANLGFMILFMGLLLNFYGDTYTMLKEFKILYILVDCIGGCIIAVSIALAFISNRDNLKITKMSLFIESAITFAFNLSLQSVVFHLLFTYSLLPVGLGVFFTFVSYCLIIVTLLVSFINSLFKRYKLILLIVYGFVLSGVIVSGVFLTFTGAIDPIISEGIGLLSLGVVSLLITISFLIFLPKGKQSISENENEVNEGEETE